MSVGIWWEKPHYLLYWVVLKKKISLKEWPNIVRARRTFPLDHPVSKTLNFIEKYGTHKS
ncbi:hypothetical protein LCGC14_1638010 [marine sediment metagenome]|uniref:Uncharacterized protein n=1 Tax=marine sediment metagenome TaxID=412755 RepID=A0A0F9KGB4_9ZZZZ